jgi:hypothetical protein
LGARDFVENSLEALSAMIGELEGHCHGIKDPTEDDLAGLSVSIAFEQLFNRHWFFSKRVVCRVRGTEDLIHRVEQDAADVTLAFLIPLDNSEVIIDVNVKLGKDAPCSLHFTEERVNHRGSGNRGGPAWPGRGRNHRWWDRGRRGRVGHCFQAMVGYRIERAEQPGIGQVSSSFRDGTEPWGGFDPAHGESEG